MKKFIAIGKREKAGIKSHKHITVWAETKEGAALKVERSMDLSYNWIVIETNRELKQ